MLRSIKERLAPKKVEESNANQLKAESRNPFVADLLAPSMIEERIRSIAVGDSERVLSTVKDFDSMVDIDYCTRLYSAPGATTTFLCEPVDTMKLKKAIDNSDARMGFTLTKGGSASDEESAARERDHGRAMLRIMGDDNERFFNTVIIEQVSRSSEEQSQSAMKALVSASAGSALTLGVQPHLQKQLYDAASPFFSDSTDVMRQAGGRPICTSTLGAALPFQDSSLDDGSGTLIGHVDGSNAPARLEMTMPSDGAPNMNVVLFGRSGSGKTTAAQKVLINEYARDAKVFIIDPERQFRAAARNAGGQWINTGGGRRKDSRGRRSGAVFSPLQPRLGNVSPDDASGDGSEVLAETLAFFHGWAELAWSVSPDRTDFLDAGLIRAYAAYGIDFDTAASDLVPDRYPIMDDLRQAYLELAHESEFEDEQREYRSLARKAAQCCEGGIYGNLWAERSSVDVSSSDFVVFDTYELHEKEAHIRTAQLFSVLSWVWTQACMSRATGKFMRIFVDEAHLFFGGGTDKVSTIAANYLNMMQRRARKYHVGLMLASQNMRDLLDESVRKQGEAIITSSAYRFYFGTDSTDLELIAESAHLTPNVARMIEGFGRGECLLQAGKRRAHVHVDFLDFEREFLGVQSDGKAR